MAVFPTAAAERLKEYNSNAYDAATNPYGMALGGHRQNFPQATADVSIVGEFVQAAAAEADASAVAAASSAGASADARALSQRWAANPEDVAVQAGLFSALHYAAKAQASAAAAATFDPANFISSSAGAVKSSNIEDRAVTPGKVVAIPAARLLGRISEGAGSFEVLTAAQVKAILGPTQLADIQAVTGPGFLGRETGTGNPQFFGAPASRAINGISRPAFTMFRTSNQGGGSGTSKVLFEGATLNQGGGANPGLGRFTAPETGMYIFTAGIQFAGGSGSGTYGTIMRKNGTDLMDIIGTRTSAAENWSACHLTAAAVMAAGDYVEAFAYFEGFTTNPAIASRSKFFGVMV